MFGTKKSASVLEDTSSQANNPAALILFEMRRETGNLLAPPSLTFPATLHEIQNEADLL